MMMKKKKTYIGVKKTYIGVKKTDFYDSFRVIEQKRMYLVIQTKYILLRKFKIYTTDKSVFIFDIIVLLH